MPLSIECGSDNAFLIEFTGAHGIPSSIASNSLDVNSITDFEIKSSTNTLSSTRWAFYDQLESSGISNPNASTNLIHCSSEPTAITNSPSKVA